MLKKSGWKILARNFRVRCAEIDIIATKDEKLIVVEVKTQSRSVVSLRELISSQKLRKLSLGVSIWLTINPHYCNCEIELWAVQVQYSTNLGFNVVKWASIGV